jgi:hypothetical protein
VGSYFDQDNWEVIDKHNIEKTADGTEYPPTMGVLTTYTNRGPSSQPTTSALD